MGKVWYFEVRKWEISMLVVIKVTRRDNDGEGYAERFAGGITLTPERIQYSLEEALEIKQTLQTTEPGIIVEFTS